jgi:nucleoside-diphosphate-sugar epimerase
MSNQSSIDWRSLHGDHFQDIPVLITGGAGFIGSHLAEVLSGLGAKVTVLDDLSGGSRENVKGFAHVQFVEGSILDQVVLERVSTGRRYVFHQAALGSVPGSVERPRAYHDANDTGTLNVLEAARLGRVQRVMFAASSSAYGDTEQLPKVESMAPRPLSPYAANKVACEALMRAYSSSYGLDTACLRYFNIFGPRQNANSAYAAVIAAFAKAALGGRNLTIYGDGEQSRDFTFVANVVHANLLAARSGKPIGGELINIACGQRITVNELAGIVMEIYGRADLKIIHEAERAGDVKHSLADLSQARRLLGYEPIVDFRTGLKPTLEWYAQVL